MTIFDKNADTQDKVQYHLRVRPGDVAGYVLLPRRPRQGGVDSGASGRPEGDRLPPRVPDGHRLVSRDSCQRHVDRDRLPVGRDRRRGALQRRCLALHPRGQQPPRSFPASPRATSSSTRVQCAATVRALCMWTRDSRRSPDHFLVRALIDAAADLGPSRGFGTHIGINVSSDGFYAETPEWVERMIKHKIMNVEMESSAIFTIAHLPRREGRHGLCMFVQTSRHPTRSTTRASMSPSSSAGTTRSTWRSKEYGNTRN